MKSLKTVFLMVALVAVAMAQRTSVPPELPAHGALGLPAYVSNGHKMGLFDFSKLRLQHSYSGYRLVI